MADGKGQEQTRRSGGRWRWIPYGIALILILGLVLYFTGHLPFAARNGETTTTTTPPPVGSGYLATSPTRVIFIQWNQSGNNASGVAQLAEVKGTAPNQTIAVQTTTVTGLFNGSNVSVDFKDVTAAFGNTSGGGYVLDFPQPDGSLTPVTFKKASAQDYNTTLAALRAQVNSANSAGSTTTTT